MLATINMIKYWSLIFFFSSLFANTFAQTGLKNDKLVNFYFAQDQISDIQSMVHFFESAYCQNKSEKCWPDLLNNFKELADSGGLDVRISIDQIDSVYTSINKATFDEIWTFEGCIKTTKTDTFPCISYKKDGAFIKLTNELGKSNMVIHDYLDSNISSGGMSPGMVASIIYKYDQFNLKDLKILMFLTIHYITLIDESTRISKSKLLE